MRRLNPNASARVREAVRAIIGYLAESAGRDKSLERVSLFHGGADGQRVLSPQVVRDYTGAGEAYDTGLFAVGLEVYFSVLCHLVSAAALTPDRMRFLEEMRQAPAAEFLRCVVDVFSGRFHARHGVDVFLVAPDSPWISDQAVERLELPLKEIILLLLKEIEDGRFDVGDPMQRLHSAVFPSNLSHAAGQFYTPPWLAEFVLTSTGWVPGERIIDPFCGSGVFLLSALRAALSKGHAIAEIAPTLVGIDISPAAACAAKTNLLLAYARHDRKKIPELAINILCADSLFPAVAQGRPPGSDSVSSGRSVEMPVDKAASPEERPSAESDAVFRVGPADVLLTNPPWVGWEYIPRNYRESLNPAWQVYSLFEHRGMKAAFLKEDLSTLCVPAALDRYLRNHGRAGLILRQSTMKSDLAGRGVRRLSIFKDSDPLELTHIHDLGNLNVFDGAVAPAAVWLLNKGKKTSFPVPVSCWSRTSSRSIAFDSTLDNVLKDTRIVQEFCRPLSAADPEGRWSFDTDRNADPIEAIKGSNRLKPRIGFFTGGANAVYYLHRVEAGPGRGARYHNIVERAKRAAPRVIVGLEPGLIYPVVRGRDVSFWEVRTEVFVLNPHTIETKIRPLSEKIMRSEYPKSFRYLRSMKRFLDQRRGFSGWERKTREEHFYAIQRIGAYSFSPYKVCWSYISDDFVIGVCGSAGDGKPLLPNDKVVFLPAATRHEAYFLAGILSFNVIRASVISSVAGRQISANVIRSYALPVFDPGDARHGRIASICEEGHRAIASQDFDGAQALYERLNLACAEMFGLSSEAVETAAGRIAGKLGYYPFKPSRKAEQGLSAAR